MPALMRLLAMTHKVVSSNMYKVLHNNNLCYDLIEIKQLDYPVCLKFRDFEYGKASQKFSYSNNGL